MHRGGVRWIELRHPEQTELIALGQEFRFHPLDIADCQKQGQRAKVERYHEYAFIVFPFPVYNRSKRLIEPGEIDIFIGPGYIVTVSEGQPAPIDALRSTVQKQPEQPSTSVGLLHAMLDRLVVSFYPMLDHISVDIHQSEHQVFSGHEKQMVAEIGLLRRNVTDFRRIVQSHKTTLKRLVDVLKLNGLQGSHQHLTDFERTIERTKEIWDLLESYRESIDTVYETNESLLTYKLNDIMRTFTTMSVVIFFMTLVATIFAIHASDTPIVESRGAFWMIIFIVALSGWLARQFFKRRRLLE